MFESIEKGEKFGKWEFLGNNRLKASDGEIFHFNDLENRLRSFKDLPNALQCIDVKTLLDHNKDYMSTTDDPAIVGAILVFLATTALSIVAAGTLLSIAAIIIPQIIIPIAIIAAAFVISPFVAAPVTYSLVHSAKTSEKSFAEYVQEKLPSQDKNR